VRAVTGVTVMARALSQCADASDWNGPFAGSMEEIMSKTNETPKLGPATPKDRRLLDDTELNAVTGGSGVNHSEFRIVKLCDAATPKLF
jgi:hypothetical protein